jgi:hypothetical protein
MLLLGPLLEKYDNLYFKFGRSLNPFAPEFVFLWLYYYLLVSAADYLERRYIRKSSTPLKANQ